MGQCLNPDIKPPACCEGVSCYLQAAAVHAFKYPSDPRRDTDCERELERLALPQLYDESFALLLLLRAPNEVGERALVRLDPTPIIKLPESDPSVLSEGDVDLAERAYGW